MRWGPVAILVAIMVAGVAWVGYIAIDADTPPSRIGPASFHLHDVRRIRPADEVERDKTAEEFRGVRRAGFDYEPVIDPQPNHPK